MNDDDNLYNGLFGNKKNQKNGNENDKTSRYNVISIVVSISFVLLYPFAIFGIFPVLYFIYLDKQQRLENVHDIEFKSFLQKGNSTFGLISGGLILVNILSSIYLIPRGYLSAYLLFPLNMIHHALVFSWQTVVALLLGGAGMASIMLTIFSFIEGRKVVSKKSQIAKVKESKAYKKRLSNKFEESKNFVEEYEEAYATAKLEGNVTKLDELAHNILLGTDEYGKPYFITLKELNQHALLPATTGGGKTVVLQIIVEHCAKFNSPCLIIDGKGAKDTRLAVSDIAGKYNREVKEFTDSGDISYNPLKYGNSIEVRDKLVSLAETESIFYSGANKQLLMGTTQLLDVFNIERDLENMSDYFSPRKVLLLFINELLLIYPDLLVFEVEESPKNKSKKSVKKEVEVVEKAEVKDSASSKYDQIEDDGVATEVVETITANPETMKLEDMYWVISNKKKRLKKSSLRMFEQLFARYEHKDNPFYLYATAESLQTNFYMLLDSELSHLFDTKTNKNELDLMEATRKNEIIYVALDGLIYTEYIHTLAQFMIADINHLASERYEITEDFPFVVLFDEPSAYLSDKFIDTVNKTRGAGVHALFAPQTLADIEAIDPILLKQLIGNTNTYIVGQTNEKSEIDYWSELFGSYDDIEITSVTQQEAGFSDVNKTDWTGEKGTKRDVENFIVHPNNIKELRTGEFYILRKGNNTHEPIRKVYMRKPI
ncbi:helicase HerA-like domain-containing protein [Carnobacterium maltaromaticum]|uniref:helicase HerA-like domain-containing protein n=1 Tax=Carnobacterium maltaromaticum TaxID=2751 RepID=UPI0006899D9A|nr:TraM recognition domain-containing protein [Carnobacterium maltaromaticum]